MEYRAWLDAFNLLILNTDMRPTRYRHHSCCLQQKHWADARQSRWVIEGERKREEEWVRAIVLSRRLTTRHIITAFIFIWFAIDLENRERERVWEKEEAKNWNKIGIRVLSVQARVLGLSYVNDSVCMCIIAGCFMFVHLLSFLIRKQCVSYKQLITRDISQKY